MEASIGLIVLLMYAIPIVLLIVFIVKVSALTARIQRLEYEILASRPTAPAKGKRKQAKADLKASTPIVISPREPRPQLQPSKAREEWESFVGGKLLNRIGALALIFGVGFFLKYAFDNNWITESLRVVLGAAAGVTLLFMGSHFHKKEYSVFAQGLIGAGIAILYLSVFASFNYYHLVSQLASFGLMSAVTVVAFHQAFKYDSPAVSILGWAGGYLTPIMLSTGVANEVGLFSYIALLQTGLLTAVLLRRKWMVLQLLTLFGTYLIFTVWYVHDYSQSAIGTTVLFLVLFWGLFHLVDIIRISTDGETSVTARLVTMFNTVFFYLYFYGMLHAHNEKILGGLTVLVAAMYAYPAVVAERNNSGLPIVRDYVLTVIGLVVIATSVQFSAFVTVAFWSLEAVVLMMLARRWRYNYVTVVAMSFFILIVGKLLLTDGAFAFRQIEDFTLLWNNRFLGFVSVAASMAACAILLKSIDIEGRDIFSTILHIGWSAVLFIVITCETIDFAGHYAVVNRSMPFARVEFLRNMVLLCVWIAYSLPLVRLGLKSKLNTLLVSGAVLTLGVFLFAVVWGIEYRPIREFELLLNPRAAAFGFILLVSVVTARWIKGVRDTNEVADIAYPVLRTAQFLLLLVLLTGETRDLFEREIIDFRFQPMLLSGMPPEYKMLENLRQLSLSGLWLVYSIVLMVVGIWRHTKSTRILALILLGMAILKIFIYDLSFLETLYRIFSFIGLGIILLTASFMYQRYKTLIFGDTTRGIEAGGGRD